MMLRLSAEDIADHLRCTSVNKSQPEADFPLELLKGTPRAAAVLIPMMIIEGEWNILFIRRTTGLVEHSGQVAFPGGRFISEDIHMETTALREAQEEIGLAPEDVRIFGQLGEFLTITNYLVTPFVGQIPWPYQFIQSKLEVARIFHIPLFWLSDPKNCEQRKRNLPEPYHPIQVTYFQPFLGEVLWGASAKFVISFLEVLGLKQTNG